MKKKLQKFAGWIKAKINLVSPGPAVLKAAAIGILIFTGIIYIYNAATIASESKDFGALLVFTCVIIIAILLGFILSWLIKILNNIPRIYKLALGICIPLLIFIFMDQVLIVLFVILEASLLAAGFYVIKKTGFKNLTIPKKIILILSLFIGLAGFGSGIYFYSLRGIEMDKIENAARLNADKIPQITGSSPAINGPYKVKMLTYGSGKDKRRVEFGKKVTLKTNDVNGVAFLDNWSGLSGKWRTMYWGFDSKELPINARVWYPEGKGPFPLVLIVHGNHGMSDFSDIGYEYLGEMLASRGMIMASVDENFLNGSMSDIMGGLEKENDARGWLLLEHLKVWHKWNRTAGNEFLGKIDTNKIALMGHSRGGEAVAHAALLNTLDYYPDDASVKLNYHFNIGSIVAIAPVDGQYMPGESLTKIRDIDYLVLHGSQDGDVTSFMGSMQFERIKFTDSNYHFKAGVYIYGANHGQFNSSWGDNDYSTPFKGLFNLEQLMSEKKQQEIAKVYISAFLESTLQGRKEYLPLFMDARQGRNWLPETIYLNQFEDSRTRYIATFDEDFDILSGSNDAVRLNAKNLTVWKEREISLKEKKKGSRAVFLGWQYKAKSKDSLPAKKVKDRIADTQIASYSIEIKKNAVMVDSTSIFVFSMAESKESSNPRSEGKWVSDKKKDTVKKSEAKENKSGEGIDKMPKKSLDLTIEFIDENGQKLSFPLSRFSALQRELEVRIWKLDFLTKKAESEKVFQKFAFPLAELMQLNAAFNPAMLARIRFVFDLSEKGVVVLDNVGFMKDLKFVQ